MAINRVILMGRLTRDPDIRYAQGSTTAIARFTLATDRDYQREGEERRADFISCIAFDKKAELIEKHFRKGNLIAIEGRIQAGSYTNKDGQTVYTTDVIVDKVSFTGEKREETPQQQAQPSVDTGGEFMSIPEGVIEELPFS